MDPGQFRDAGPEPGFVGPPVKGVHQFSVEDGLRCDVGQLYPDPFIAVRVNGDRGVGLPELDAGQEVVPGLLEVDFPDLPGLACGDGRWRSPAVPVLGLMPLRRVWESTSGIVVCPVDGLGSRRLSWSESLP